MKVLIAVAIVATIAVLVPDIAHAAATAGGTGMPWDTPITNIKNNLTGPTAFALSLIAAAVALAMLVFAHHHLEPVVQRLIMVVFVLAIVSSLATGATWMGIAGATI